MHWDPDGQRCPMCDDGGEYGGRMFRMGDWRHSRRFFGLDDAVETPDDEPQETGLIVEMLLCPTCWYTEQVMNLN